MFGFLKELVSDQEIDPSKYFREATQAKDRGNLDEAIKQLRKASGVAWDSEIVYGIKPFLRLPMYLQEAGRPEEAMLEFKRLLAGAFPGNENDPQLVPMNRSAVYDKIRLVCEREGKTQEAVKYGVMSHLSWAIGLKKQRRTSEFRDHVCAETVDKMIKRHLRKAKALWAVDAVRELVRAEIKSIPGGEMDALGEAIDKVLAGGKPQHQS